MKDYVEIQSRRKAHELVLMIYMSLGLANPRNKAYMKLKDSVDSIPAELYEAHGRLFEDEKLKHISRARGHLYEVKYYIDFLTELGKMNRYVKRQTILKVELLDKLLLSMIRSKKYSLR